MKPLAATCLAFGTIAVCAAAMSICAPGTPWNNQRQHIPGRVQCELYDLGGEGTAYHDADSINNGSGKLNPANGTYLNEFRMKEGVDISYTKSNSIDNTAHNLVQPDMDQLYVGWTQPGEWIRYTIMADTPGRYSIDVMYTAHDNGTIALDVDGRRATSNLTLTSTFAAADTVAWRQWHHWNKAVGLAEIELTKGVHVLTLHTVAAGQMNFDYLEFNQVAGKK